MSSKMQITFQGMEGGPGVPCEGKGWPWPGDSPGAGGWVPPSTTSARQRGGVLTKPPSLPCPQDGPCLARGGLNPKFADVATNTPFARFVGSSRELAPLAAF